MARLERAMTTGCLTVLVVLIVVLSTVLGMLWYWSRHTDKVNAEHRQQALLALDDQLRRTKNETIGALGNEGSADPDALTAVIHQHTGAPVISYDAFRHTFRARVVKRVEYESRSLFGISQGVIGRCLEYTYAPAKGHGWTSTISVVKYDTCGPSVSIGSGARTAGQRVAALEASELNLTGVRRALAPYRRFLTVSAVTRTGSTVTVSVVVSEETTRQCYRITRNGSQVFSVPVQACQD
ncbi:hypothetical protein PYK79_24175 [Streptomyces sp. ID05-04B]|uniref:hypothetical protein n=1 Tax=Streptomyces sp. ID05-04B TaxID=3028661 RepID=UPI0029C2826C|nr:hypothetical protein [Streptomyces sp. ID05-04B]MDX5565798.1 hypothetical protein [Streptomyces sp. ID05-04B]